MKFYGSKRLWVCRQLVLILVLQFACAVGAYSATVDTEADREWHFQVTLDGKPIGNHSFRVYRLADETRVISEASYKVKWLVFTAYEYRHRSEEIWQNGCLHSISSSTRDGGEHYQVAGLPDEQGMLLKKNGEESILPDSCIRSFAYWDASLLRGSKLLNPQTGELESVALADGGNDQPEWLESAATEHYQLATPEMPIHLWYDNQGRWLGLEAELENGSLLRYSPVPGKTKSTSSGGDA